MRCLVLVLWLGLAWAEFNGDCELGAWRQWGECLVAESCEDSESFVSEAPVHGNRMMELIMRMKADEIQRKLECRAEGSCPELDFRPSGGFVACEGGFAGDIPCENVDQMSFVNLLDLGFHGNIDMAFGNDIWGWTDPDNGDEYAIMGLNAGTSFVRITDASNPVPVGYLPAAIKSNFWRDVKVIGNYAYIVSEALDSGLQIFDLTQLRGREALENDTATAWYQGFGNAHNVIANEETGFLYVVGSMFGDYPDLCSGGLNILDVSDPLNVVNVGCYGDDGYSHDAQCLIYHGPDTRFQGREICFAYNEDTLTIIDVNDKNDMQMLSRIGYNGSRYTHQGWLTEDHTIVLLDDELDEILSTDKRTRTYLWDVASLTEPVLMRTYYHNVEAADHNQYVVGDYTFQANYQSGLRLFRIDQANYDLSLVGIFDVFPEQDTANYNGAWSVYPYYNSGNIVVSSIEFGLFVLRPDWAAIEAQARARSSYGQRSRTRELLSKYPYDTCPPRQQWESCEAEVTC